MFKKVLRKYLKSQLNKVSKEFESFNTMVKSLTEKEIIQRQFEIDTTFNNLVKKRQSIQSKMQSI